MNQGRNQMRQWQVAALAAAGFLALSGCAPQPTDSAAFEQQAKEDVRRFIPAFNTGDMETILAQYAPDAEVMAPGNARAVGHDAIRTLLEKESAGLQAAGLALVATDDDKAAASGDLGHHSGSFVVKDAAGTVVDSGNYLAVMQRQPDGKWLMIRDIWNSDRPPPAPPAAEPAAAETPAG
jgi:ketosteroid isomerase-like protein